MSEHRRWSRDGAGRAARLTGADPTTPTTLHPAPGTLVGGRGSVHLVKNSQSGSCHE